MILLEVFGQEETELIVIFLQTLKNDFEKENGKKNFEITISLFLVEITIKYHETKIPIKKNNNNNNDSREDFKRQEILSESNLNKENQIVKKLIFEDSNKKPMIDSSMFFSLFF